MSIFALRNGVWRVRVDYEVWVFTRSQQGILFGAEPLGLYHGKFPFDVPTAEPEMYSLFSALMLERVAPMS